MDQGDKWSDPGYMLKLVLMGFADGLVLIVGRKASGASLHLGGGEEQVDGEQSGK